MQSWCYEIICGCWLLSKAVHLPNIKKIALSMIIINVSGSTKNFKLISYFFKIHFISFFERKENSTLEQWEYEGHETPKT